MISQRLDDENWALLADVQKYLYGKFNKALLTQDTIYAIASAIELYIRHKRDLGFWIPRIDWYVGVNPFQPSTVEIYDYQNYHYIFPKERVPKMSVRVSL